MSTMKFSESFRIWEEWLGVRRKHVLRAVQNPDRIHVVTFDAMQEGGRKPEVSLYLSEQDAGGESVVWLVQTTIENGQETVVAAWPIRSGIAPPSDDPLEVFRWLCEKFGCDLQVGGLRGRFFLNQVVRARPGAPVQHQVGVVGGVEQGDELDSRMLIRVRDSGDLDVGLAYAFARREISEGLRGGRRN